MRALALILALSTAVATSACDRASASDEEFGAQLVQDSLANEYDDAPAESARWDLAASHAFVRGRS